MSEQLERPKVKNVDHLLSIINFGQKTLQERIKHKEKLLKEIAMLDHDMKGIKEGIQNVKNEVSAMYEFKDRKFTTEQLNAIDLFGKWHGLKWTDVTSYSQRENIQTREPRSFELKLENEKYLLIIYITKGHIDYPNQWIMHCNRLNFDARILGSTKDLTTEQAQQKAIERVKDKALNYFKMLDEI